MMLARSSMNQAQILRSAARVAAQSQFRNGLMPLPSPSRVSIRSRHAQRYLFHAQQQPQLVVRWKVSTTRAARQRIQEFSTQPPKTVVATTEKTSFFSRYKHLARVVRFARIAGVVASVYALGYQQGVINCTRSPRLMEDELLQTILADVGVRSKEQVHIFSAQDTPAFYDTTPKGKLQAQTIRIGNDIIRCASLYVRQELVQAIKAVSEQLPPDISPAQAQKLLQEDEYVKYWELALYRVEGENLHLPWKYVLVDSPLPNAFVSEILPQRFFITTSMFQHFIANQDELAVILGHEISHLILYVWMDLCMGGTKKS